MFSVAKVITWRCERTSQLSDKRLTGMQTEMTEITPVTFASVDITSLRVRAIQVKQDNFSWLHYLQALPHDRPSNRIAHEYKETEG